MNDCLVIMHPRTIEPCLQAFQELDIDKVWLRGFTERAISDHWSDVLDTGHDWYWVVSDDVIARPPALNAVRNLRDAGDHPVVTGYSQFSHTDWTVNLTSQPLVGDHPDERSYQFRSYQDVVSWPEPAVPTWFTGMSLTGMGRDLWQRFPFDCFSDPGYASDFNLSIRLQANGVPIVAAREGFVYHWRHESVYTDASPDEKVSIGYNDLVYEPLLAAVA